MHTDKLKELYREHTPEGVRARIHGKPPLARLHLRDAVLGGMDGCITTFAIVAGAAGASLESLIVIILGFSNLVADGLSMAIGNYLGVKSEREQLQAARREEQEHIALIPEGEKEEIPRPHQRVIGQPFHLRAGFTYLFNHELFLFTDGEAGLDLFADKAGSITNKDINASFTRLSALLYEIPAPGTPPSTPDRPPPL